MKKQFGLAVVLMTVMGCQQGKDNSPEGVADRFAEAYFVRADQQGAKEFTALGASKMLEDEIARVEAVRKDGYDNESVSRVSIKRQKTEPREQRIRVFYDVTVKSEQGDRVRKADIEVAQIDGAWKVVRLGLEQ